VYAPDWVCVSKTGRLSNGIRSRDRRVWSPPTPGHLNIAATARSSPSGETKHQPEHPSPSSRSPIIPVCAGCVPRPEFPTWLKKTDDALRGVRGKHISSPRADASAAAGGAGGTCPPRTGPGLVKLRAERVWIRGVAACNLDPELAAALPTLPDLPHPRPRRSPRPGCGSWRRARNGPPGGEIIVGRPRGAWFGWQLGASQGSATPPNVAGPPSRCAPASWRRIRDGRPGDRHHAGHGHVHSGGPQVVVRVRLPAGPLSIPIRLRCVTAKPRYAGSPPKSDALDIDAARIGVYGMSAGAGLAAALTLLVRDPRRTTSVLPTARCARGR